MSPRDPKLPAEAQVMSQGPSDVSGMPSPTTPSPGVSLGPARTPTAPTLPDWDPITLSRVVQLVANDLFSDPLGVGSVTSSPTLLESAPAAGPVSAPSAPTATSTPVPDGLTASPNPFFVAPQLDHVLAPDPAALGFTDSLELMRFPLVDDVPMTAPEVPALAAVPATSTPSVPNVDVPWQVEPHVGFSDVRTPGASSGNVPAVAPTRGAFDAYAIRKEFPILEERVHGKRLVWLDNAATTQKPRAVIDRLTYFYEHENSNIHRAAHALAARATDAYENARETVRRFLNAGSVKDIVFVRGATEGINLVAQSWGRRNIEAGDEIVITWLEHHANIVPWQMLAAEKGARLRVAPVDDRGQIILDEYERLLGPRTKLVALPQVSNALGTITPAKTMIEMAHRHGARVLLDGAQSVSHMRVDVQSLGPDFLVFSGHKIFAPTGIGAVYAPSELLDATPPWQGGGNMIQDVTFEKTIYQPAPARFEAGTGNIADAVGLGAALDWLTRVGLENVERHEHDLLVYATREVARVPGLKIIGTAAEKAGVLSFTLAGHSTHDVSTALDKEGIAVRGGHHCAQPILRRFGLESTVRASLAPYNVREDIDALVAALLKLQAQRS